MKGFFTKAETQSTTRKDGKTYSCISCGLYKTCESPKLEPHGNFKKGILNIFEAPSAQEDVNSRHIRDSYFDKVLRDNGIDQYEDCLNTFSMKCRPPDDKELNKLNFELDCCRIHLMRVIKKHKPKLILVHGKNSLYGLIGSRWEGALDSFEKWRGWVIPDQALKTMIAPIYHVHLAPKNENTKTIFENDVKIAIANLTEDFPEYVPPKIVTLRKSLNALKKISNGSTIAFDIETTGLKPHEKGHRIICASVAVSEDKVYTFMIPKEKEKRKPFLDVLKSRYIQKAAHNIAFEDVWCKERLGLKVKNWHWCSMQMAHILDNRTGVTGLKFLTYVYFGVMDYSSEIKPYLKGKSEKGKKNANAFNTLQKYCETPDGREKVLEYVALDSIYQYRLMSIQKRIIENIIPF